MIRIGVVETGMVTARTEKPTSFRGRVGGEAVDGGFIEPKGLATAHWWRLHDPKAATRVKPQETGLPEISGMRSRKPGFVRS